jgi:hypothetical protein
VFRNSSLAFFDSLSECNYIFNCIFNHFQFQSILYFERCINIPYTYLPTLSSNIDHVSGANNFGCRGAKSHSLARYNDFFGSFS